MDEATLRSLYLEEGLSAKQIADRLGVPESKVVYWLRKYQIPKRSLSEAVYRRINQGGDPFNIKADLSPEEEKLKVAGLMLWVTEGSLKNKDAVYTSNSDHALIKLFVEFLLRICRVDQSKLRLGVMYYPDMDMSIDAVREFWKQVTGLPDEQINIHTYRATHDYRAKSRYGTATLAVSNIKLRAVMEQWLNELYGEIS